MSALPPKADIRPQPRHISAMCQKWKFGRLVYCENYNQYNDNNKNSSANYKATKFVFDHGSALPSMRGRQMTIGETEIFERHVCYSRRIALARLSNFDDLFGNDSCYRIVPVRQTKSTQSTLIGHRYTSYFLRSECRVL